MSQKKEIKKYINENIKMGFSKEEIRNLLLQKYQEKDFKSILLQYPDPKLKKKYSAWNNALVVLLIISTLLKLLGLIGVGVEAEVGFTAILFLLLIGIPLNIVFIIAVMKNRAWAYPLLGILAAIGFFQELRQLSIAGETIAFYDALINSSFLLAIAILSFFLWVKIHPDYFLFKRKV